MRLSLLLSFLSFLIHLYFEARLGTDGKLPLREMLTTQGLATSHTAAFISIERSTNSSGLLSAHILGQVFRTGNLLGDSGLLVLADDSQDAGNILANTLTVA